MARSCISSQWFSSVFILVAYCPSGPIALNFGGVSTQCSGGSCQQGYTCTPVGSQQLCCPSASESVIIILTVKQANKNWNCLGLACTANLDAGTTCNGISSTTAFYFNTQTRQCTQFTYNGCGGGPNNFQSFSSCQSACSNIGEQKFVLLIHLYWMVELIRMF